MRGKDNGEVSSDALASFRIFSERYSGNPEAVFAHDPDYFAQVGGRVSWDKVVELYQRVDAMLPPEMSIEELGGIIFESQELGSSLRALAFFASPAHLIFFGNRFGLERTFSHLTVEQRIERSGMIRLTVEIPSAYEDSPLFFRATAGIIKVFPRLIGAPDADVHIDLQPRRGTYRIVPPKSRTFMARVVGFARRVLGVGALVDELTEQRQELNHRIRELSETNRELEDALEARNRFLEVVSHELKTPLIGISGGVAALEQNGRRENEEALVDLRRSYHRLDEVVTDLLEQARARSGGIIVDPAPVHLPRLIASVVQTFQELASFEGIELLAPDVGGLPERVKTDGPRLGRAIAHLVSNAVRFTHEGRVEISAAASAGVLRIEVADTGPGVPEELRARLFEAFRQGDGSARRAATGLGLGLGLTRALMEALGGRVELVKSDPTGSRFALEMPLEVLHESGPATVPARRSVLVVDDDRINRRVLSRLLANHDLEVRTAENGQEAIEVAETLRPSLVIMDYEMPVMDGVEATRRLCAANGSVIVLGWSASARPEVREAMRGAGARDFLEKPMTPSALSDALSDLGILDLDEDAD